MATYVRDSQRKSHGNRCYEFTKKEPVATDFMNLQRKNPWQQMLWIFQRKSP